jgi:Cu/Ag efflux protein CusF
MMRRLAAAVLGAALACSSFAQAAMTEGVVRKVDRASGKITLKHGEIKNLDMPPMTMVFRLKDKSLLGQLKAGDKVNFTADQDGNGQYVVRTLEARK